jgi:hypothetical protein
VHMAEFNNMPCTTFLPPPLHEVYDTFPKAFQQQAHTQWDSSASKTSLMCLPYKTN